MSQGKQYDSMFRLDGKVALVTGASKGIGAAMAHALAAYGASVALCSRKQEAVDAVAAELVEAGLEATGFAANVGEIDDIAALVDAVTNTYGGIDLLINNAAANPVFGSIENTDERAFDKIIEVNLKGPFELCKRVQPSMRARGGGSIVNISSIGGIRPEANIGIYSASKAAIVNLSKAMAQDWGRDGIRVNAICPGLIKTRFSEALWQDDGTRERFEARIPLGRIGETDDLAGLAVYLASDASAYCSGGVYMVDGGYSAG